MHYVVNDLSLAGQFQDHAGFGLAIDRVMAIRNEIVKYGAALYCHRRLAQATVSEGVSIQQAVARLEMDKRRALMQWLTSHGPYWEDDQAHSGDDWYAVNDTVVTDTGLAEVAACVARGLPREAVSLHPSAWLSTLIVVKYVTDAAEQEIPVCNHWDLSSVRESLEANAKKGLDTWAAFEAHSRRTYAQLTFGPDAFRPLEGQPFGPGAAERLLLRFDILNRLKSCFEKGQRTPSGDALYAQYFTGSKAWFSDSSDTEKREFSGEMVFKDPEESSAYLSCTWHGKIKTPQYRVHFTYPVLPDRPLYVMYVGPKITKR